MQLRPPNPFVGEAEQIPAEVAGKAIFMTLAQLVENAPVGPRAEGLVTVDELQQRHGLATK